MEHIDDIIHGIDEGLSQAKVVDMRLSLEASVWNDLDESVQAGWRTQQEAEDTFMQWRSVYRGAGQVSIRKTVES